MARATLALPSLKATVGLEVHVQLATRTKLFSSAPSESSTGPNEGVALLDAAVPGTLPLLNRQALVLAIRTGLLLNCSIPLHSSFDRKHYFYADMPAGYQITQHREPVATAGHFAFHPLSNGEDKKTVDILQVQLEQDSGKSLHEGSHSLIDLNRSGCALVEIVTGPCLGGGAEAASFIRQLRLLLIHHGITHGLMHRGNLRVDANVSVSADRTLGQRTEIKNMNSIADVESAIDYEVQRQKEIVARGDQVVFETRAVDRGKTVRMRDKETIDYRFMRETNLPRVRSPPSLVEALASSIRQSPALHQRLIDNCGFPPHSAVYLEEDEELASFVHSCWGVDGGRSLSAVGGPLFMDWLTEMKQQAQRKRSPFPPSRDGAGPLFIGLLLLLKEARITKLVALDVLRALDEGIEETTAEEWVERRGLWRMKEGAEVEAEARAVVEGATVTTGKKALMRMRNELVQRSNKRIDVDDAIEALQRVLAARE